MFGWFKSKDKGMDTAIQRMSGASKIESSVISGNNRMLTAILSKGDYDATDAFIDGNDDLAINMMCEED